MPGGLQPPEEVVEAGLKALDRGGGLVVPRLLNKSTLFVQRFLPRSWVTRITATLFREGGIKLDQ
jgi:short-subunit dehydrogenase